MAISRILPFALLATQALGAAHPPVITPAPSAEERDRALAARADPGAFIQSIISSLGSGVSSYIASGVPQFFQDFPVGQDVEKALGINDEDLKATPTQVLNIPGYANWTNDGWSVRIHGNVYKQPDIDQKKLDSLANIFLVGVDIDELPPNQQKQARNLTSEIFVVQQNNVSVTVNFQNDVHVQPNASGGVYNARGGAQSIDLPYRTTPEGDFDAWLTLKNTTGPNGGYLLAGNQTDRIQALNIYTNGTDTGNATAYLVPPQGFTIVSDIDDILRVTKIYDPKEGLLNSFARPFTAWENMPEIYANWSASIPNFHFHYLTTTPEQVTRNYMEFIYKTYPLGSFDTRPLNFSDVQATLSIRRSLLDKIFKTFPQRKFVLVGDTTNSDVMRDYPALVKDYPGQVQCIFLRNTTATDATDLFPYDTSGFEGIDQKQYMFFVHPDDLKGVDIVGGNCYNPAVKQNVTFGYQGRGFGNDESAASSMMRRGWSWGTLIVGLVMAVAML
ncbi:hypothetical protein F5Y17DRAFT_422589 [Xylariaceae sp. FL0594]|nr:hypothetical protein F5Y17DRAFT_422589 [Xylariaceae sp. FL0594]